MQAQHQINFILDQYVERGHRTNDGMFRVSLNGRRSLRCRYRTPSALPAFARVERRIARGAIEGDARLDAVEDEGVAFGVCDSDVGLGIDFEIDRATVAQLASDDILNAFPAAFVGERGMVDDGPEFVVGEIDRVVVLIPRPPRIRADQDDLPDLARFGGLYQRWVEATPQDARDPFDLALLTANEVADAPSRLRARKRCSSSG